jgi:hypothetical protein
LSALPLIKAQDTRHLCDLASPIFEELACDSSSFEEATIVHRWFAK